MRPPTGCLLYTSCYDLRGSDYDPGEPVCVEEQVVVNHAGSVLLTEPLELAEDGRLMLTEEEGLNFVGGFSTLTQFLQEQRKDVYKRQVEGNSGDACKIKSYDLNYQSIKGYGLMNW